MGVPWPTVIADVRILAGEALRLSEPEDKRDRIATMVAAVESESWPTAADGPVDIVPVVEVGRSARITYVAPRDLKRRTWGSPAGRFATLHALAHIEANAVNLALDAVHRFAAMPADYYRDWVRIASEELSHFDLLERRLAASGGAYGDLGCHDGLWDIAVRTADDVVARMALVPLVFEARGLDVTPGLIERFERHGDAESADVLRIVLRDEVGHVAAGARWFRVTCASRALDPVPEFERLVEEHSLLLVPPFNVDARVAAGFDADDLARWSTSFAGGRAAPGGSN